LRYATVEKTGAGLKPRLIEVEGPTGLILTTTANSVHPENETRLLSVTMTDTPEQTERVLLAMASDAPTPDAGELDDWRVLNEWLAYGPRTVCIPFATALAKRTYAGVVRMRRDFGAVLTLIKAHALLHRASREQDAVGRVIATLDDYAAVRELIVDIISEGGKAAVSSSVRETVAAVRHLDPCDSRPPSVSAVAKSLGIDESAANRRVSKAIDLGFLVNEEPRLGRPALLRLGEPLPDDSQALPRVEELVNEDCDAAETIHDADADPDETLPANRSLRHLATADAQDTFSPGKNGFEVEF
jgi:hypothetical protein